MEIINEHVTIAGPTGTGKSYTTGAIFEQYYTGGRPWVLFDTKQLNHIGLYALKDVVLLKIAPDTFYNFERALDYPFILCIPERKMKTTPLIDTYKQFLEIIFDERRPGALGVEEAHLYNNGPNAPDDILELITREGRGYDINILYMTQRIQDFPKLLWSQCRKSYIFKSLIPQDVDYIARMVPEYPNLNYQLGEHDVLKYYHDKNQYSIIPAEKIYRYTPHYG